MFWVTRYLMISKTESVGYRKKYRVAGRVRVPAEHWMCDFPSYLQPWVIARAPCIINPKWGTHIQSWENWFGSNFGKGERCHFQVEKPLREGGGGGGGSCFSCSLMNCLFQLLLSSGGEIAKSGKMSPHCFILVIRPGLRYITSNRTKIISTTSSLLA